MSQQVYRRIANPYMPQGTPDKTNAPLPLYAPGELGYAFSDQNTGGEYLRVQLDSGATGATLAGGGPGGVSEGELAFWMDQPNAIVTNDKRFCDVGVAGSINRVAGVFQLAVDAGNVCDLIIRRPQSWVLAAQALAGAQMVADQTGATARATYLTGVTTPVQSQVIGVCHSATARVVTQGNLYLVDVSIGFAE